MSAGDLFLKPLDLFGPKFDNVSGINPDEMIMVFLVGCLIARAAIREGMALKDTLGFKNVHGPVNRCDRDTGIDPGYPAMKFHGIRMVGGVQQHLHDDLARLRKP